MPTRALMAAALGTLCALGPAAGQPGKDAGPTSEQKKATVAYILTAARPGGGFGDPAKAGSPATVPDTFAAVHALRYFGGALPDPKRCAAFLVSCRDRGKRAFAAVPGGPLAPDATAHAARTLVELRGAGKGGVYRTINSFWGSYSVRTADGPVTDADMMDAVVDSLLQSPAAKSPDDYRRLGEVLEAAGRTGSVRFYPLNELITDLRKLAADDGTYGIGDRKPADTAAAVIACRGSGLGVQKREAVEKFLVSAQRSDGGWGAGTSDLETTARVVHALALLGVMPDAAKYRAFVAACRATTGAYGPAPGQPGSLSATYSAGSVLHHLDAIAADQ